jgi:hypothetical protein
MDFVNVNVKQDWGKKTLIDDGVTCLMILLWITMISISFQGSKKMDCTIVDVLTCIF